MNPSHFTFKRDGRDVSSVKTCPVCDGSGLYTLEEPTCPQCDGKGLVWDVDYVQTLLDRIAELEENLRGAAQAQSTYPGASFDRDGGRVRPLSDSPTEGQA